MIAVQTVAPSASHLIPLEALAQHTAVVGQTGEGKSYTSRGIVERLLDEKRRVVILDPTGVWYGLRAGADGKPEGGYPVAIFGGEHGDVPIGPASGAALGSLLATRNISAVLDVSEMTPEDQIIFATDLLAALYQQNKKTLHLVIDEADEFGPQTLSVEGSKACLDQFARIVKRGRVKGFRVLALTQRPADLAKRVLSQVKTLLAKKVMGALDRDALEKWLKGHGDEATTKTVITGLAKLTKKEAWLWAPELDLLRRYDVPMIKTFDSMRAPEGDDDEVEPETLQTIDAGELAALLALAPEKEIEAHYCATPMQAAQTAKHNAVLMAKHEGSYAPTSENNKGLPPTVKINPHITPPVYEPGPVSMKATLPDVVWNTKKDTWTIGGVPFVPAVQFGSQNMAIGADFKTPNGLAVITYNPSDNCFYVQTAMDDAAQKLLPAADIKHLVNNAFADGEAAGYDKAAARWRDRIAALANLGDDLEGGANKKSYIFDGPVNMASQDVVLTTVEGTKKLDPQVFGEAHCEAWVTAMKDAYPVLLTWAQIGTLIGKKAHGGWFNKTRKWLIDNGRALEQEDGKVYCTDVLHSPAYQKIDPPYAAEKLRIRFQQALPLPAAGMYERLLLGAKTVKHLAQEMDLADHGGYWNKGMHKLRELGLVKEDANGLLHAHTFE